MNSFTEENYLKAIYVLNRKKKNGASTNAISKRLDTKASSVTDMIKKLADKKLVNYKKYQGVTLTEKGKKVAINIIRKHRLWEYFLVEKLHFKWDEVHEIAEELEHINSEKLINRLDEFLDHPEYDPHGDPIPDKEGNIHHHKDVTLADLKKEEAGIIVGVKDSSVQFLQYLENMKLVLGAKVETLEFFEFDQSMKIRVNQSEETVVSPQVSKNLYVKKKH